jgi:hypothetical protein
MPRDQCHRLRYPGSALRRSWLAEVWARITGSFHVLTGKSIPITVYSEDTTVIVIETKGSQVTYLTCRNIAAGEYSYNIKLSKIVLWACTKNRFFWTADKVGAQVFNQAEEEFQKHKNDE